MGKYTDKQKLEAVEAYRSGTGVPGVNYLERSHC
jgi:hypothetical protein